MELLDGFGIILVILGFLHNSLSAGKNRNGLYLVQVTPVNIIDIDAGKV